MTIHFNTYLNDDDWIAKRRGWRCDALLIPGIKIEALYYDEERADDQDFTIEDHIICWTSSPRPTDLLVTLSLANSKFKIEEEKLLLERGKFNLEQKRTSLATRWKWISAGVAALSILLTFGITYILIRPNLNQSEPAPPRVHTYTKKISIPEDQCIESIEKRFKNYGLKSIDPVQGGIYATQENYNIFVVCGEDAKVIFIVVSGPEDSQAKQIRENIKNLIP